MSPSPGVPELVGAALHLGRRRLETSHGVFDLHLFRDLARARSAMAIVRGDMGEAAPLLARAHSSCVTSECLGACDCDCADQLEGALAMMARAGRGVLFYLMQEGRGAGLTAKARDRMIVQASGHRMTTFEAFAEMGLPSDLRSYEELAPMARWLGIRAPLRLLTNNPEKAEAVERALRPEKIEIDGIESIQGPGSPFNADYLDAKERSGHALDLSCRLPGALAPERLGVESPAPALGAPHLLSTARYLLPIAFSDEPVVDWFPLRIVFDRRSARETIVLSSPWRAERTAVGTTTEAKRAGDGPRAWHLMQLIDRLPGRGGVGRRALQESLRAMRGRSGGAVVIDFEDTEPGDVSRDGGASWREDGRARAEEILEARWPSEPGGRDAADAED